MDAISDTSRCGAGCFIIGWREQLDFAVSHVLLRDAIKAMDQHLAEVVDAQTHITECLEPHDPIVEKLL